MKINLPDKIKVSVKKGTISAFLVELPEYGVFTEADTMTNLFFQVNDLIYTYFDVPKKLRGKVVYAPEIKSSEQVVEKKLPLRSVEFTILHRPGFSAHLSS